MMKPVIDKVVGGVLLVGFLAGMVGYGGGKTNSVPPNLNAPFAPMGEMHPLQGLARLIWPEAFGPRILSQQLQLADAETMAANWNVRGAWRDSFKLDFDAGWVLPWGTNHLTSVEVLSHGEIRPQWNDTNAVARLGVPVSIVPGLTNFSFELTPSNSYRFAWTDAVIGRAPRNTQPNNLMTASLELFRNGDVAVTTNGVTRTIPRELPFDHDGFGQDAEWVAANFTNATEIAAAGGYPAWVDAQVGEGLTNGLYKLTVTVADDPPEITLLPVGDLSVAVTNAGEYVFLLEKGVEYALDASSDCATNFVYSAVDDVPAEMLRSGALQMRSAGDGYDGGQWTQGVGGLSLIAPFGFVSWKPTLTVASERWRPSRATATRTFRATVSDCPSWLAPSYTWASRDAAVCSVTHADGPTATFDCHFPSADGSWVSLVLDVGLSGCALTGTALRAEFDYYVPFFAEADDYEDADGGEYEEPPDLVLSASPSVVFFESGTANAEMAEVGCYYHVTEAGAFALTLAGDAVAVTDRNGATVASGYTWTTDGGVIGARHFLVESLVKSSSPSGTVLTVTFTPENGTNALTRTANVAFVEVSVVAKAMWPNNQTRRTLGVFEEAYIYLSPMIQNLQLSGRGGVSGNGAWSYDYTAPSNATTDVIRNSDGTDVCTLDIIAPSGYAAVITQVLNRATQASEAGSFELFFQLELLPKTVSFAKIEVMEQGMTATNAVGYFREDAHTNLLSHSHIQGAWQWTEIGLKNNDAQSDRVGVMELPPPWGAGGFMTWPIPNVYREKGATWVSEPFCNTDQSVTLEPDGTVWLEKFNQIESCTTNRQFNGWIRTNL